MQCPHFNCVVMNKRSDNNNIHVCSKPNFRSFFDNITAFDAVVFHERDLNKNDLPKQRSPHQLFLHFNLEAPVHASIRGEIIQLKSGA